MLKVKRDKDIDTSDIPEARQTALAILFDAQAEVIAGGVGQILFDAKVAFSCLNGRMPE